MVMRRVWMGLVLGLGVLGLSCNDTGRGQLGSEVSPASADSGELQDRVSSDAHKDLRLYAEDLVGSSTDLDVAAVEEAIREGCLHVDSKCNLPLFGDCRARNCIEESELVVYVDCLGLFANDQWQVAYECFRKLPADSCFARIAKDKIARCVEQLTKFHRAESLAYEQAGRLWKALEHELTLFALHPCDLEIYARLRALEPRVEVPAGRDRPRIAWDQAACGNSP